MEIAGRGEGLADQGGADDPPSRSIRLPLAWRGKNAWAIPVMASG